jgi:hypothetical protein
MGDLRVEFGCSLFKRIFRKGEIAMRRVILIVSMSVTMLITCATPAGAEQAIDRPINFVDYSVFAAHWLDFCIECGADFTGDLIVDLNDLRILSANWLEEHFLVPSYEYGIYAGGLGGEGWAFMLRGTGNPIPVTGGEYGGKDKVNGNMFVDGDVDMYQESSVNPSPPPNPYGIGGDVNSTGSINLYDSSTVSGDIIEYSAPPEALDLVGMNYAEDCTHDVAQIFMNAGVTQGYLPVGNPLRNVFVINPADRSAECASTAGDDFFFEPSSGFIVGNWKTAPTPLNVGNNRIYYVDGDVWVHSKSTFGFTLGGKATIVATGNIHLCDNTVYADANSMLGLVALGEYDEEGNLVSGGNVYFGDPTYGTMYIFSAMMFAAHNFLYSTNAVTGEPEEPLSGFTVNGNVAGLNAVSIERDWYTKVTGHTSERRPARYDDATGQWVDSETGAVLTTTEISTLKHYQMIINYDDRVRNADTQPPGLPRGDGIISDCSPLR